MHLELVVAQVPSPSPSPLPYFQMGAGGVAIVLSVVVLIVMATAAYAQRHTIVALLQRNDTFRAVCYVGEPFVTFGLGIVVTAFDLWKPATWNPPNSSLPAIVPLSVALFAGATSLKFFAAWAKEKEKEKIRTLELDLQSLHQENATLKDARRCSVKIADQVRVVVEEKLHRLAHALLDPKFSAESYFSALDSRAQLQFIIMMIHGFFASEVESRNRKAAMHTQPVFSSEPSWGWLTANGQSRTLPADVQNQPPQVD
jgi:hypothetical protein